MSRRWFHGAERARQDGRRGSRQYLIPGFPQKQERLEMFDPVERLDRLAEILKLDFQEVPVSEAVLTRWAEAAW
jgi:hypothetical protein